jgi:hypothetical protein
MSKRPYLPARATTDNREEQNYIPTGGASGASELASTGMSAEWAAVGRP